MKFYLFQNLRIEPKNTQLDNIYVVPSQIGFNIISFHNPESNLVHNNFYIISIKIVGLA